jgi:hypothetical protein
LKGQMTMRVSKNWVQAMLMTLAACDVIELKVNQVSPKDSAGERQVEKPEAPIEAPVGSKPPVVPAPVTPPAPTPTPTPTPILAASIKIWIAAQELVGSSVNLPILSQTVAQPGPQHTIRIRNEGTAPLSISLSTLPAPFSVSGAVASLLPQQETLIIVSISTSSVVTLTNFNLVIRSNDSLRPAVTFSGQGQVIAAPVVVVPTATAQLFLGSSELSGTSINLPALNGAVGPTLVHQIKIRNTGTANLQTSVSGARAPFSLVNPSPTLAPQLESTLEIRLPTNTVTPTSSMSLVLVTNDPTRPTITLLVSGAVAAAPKMSIKIKDSEYPVSNSAAVDLGKLMLRESPHLKKVGFEIRNDGQAPLTVNTITPPAGFLLVPQKPTAPIDVGSIWYSTLYPLTGAVSIAAGAMTVASNDPLAQNFLVNLKFEVLERSNLNTIGDALLNTTLQASATGGNGRPILSSGKTDWFDPFRHGIFYIFVPPGAGGGGADIVKPDECTGNFSDLILEDGQVTRVSDSIDEVMDPNMPGAGGDYVRVARGGSSILGPGFCVSSTSTVNIMRFSTPVVQTVTTGRWVSTLRDVFDRANGFRGVDTAHCQDSKGGISAQVAGYVKRTLWYSGQTYYEGSRCLNNGQVIQQPYCHGSTSGGFFYFNGSADADYDLIPDYANRSYGSYSHQSYGKLVPGACETRTVTADDGTQVQTAKWVPSP